MFDADKPITKSDQDRLGRAVFAKYLARCILDHKTPESLVIGLAGAGGTGKTSLINLTLEELRFAASNLFDDEKPIILNFSPWSYSGQHQLIYSFFRRLSSELRQVSYLHDADRVITLLELYVSFFTHQAVPTPLQSKRTWLDRLLFRKKSPVIGWEAGRDLTQVKAELNDLLSKRKHKIIIIIDNIARIEDEEIKQIFQIVKSIGDYANTVYLLSYDKQRVKRAIHKMYGMDGDEYLEKLVQLPFEIPAIAKQDLENILFDRLKSIIALAPEDTWNTDYWADVYYSVLKQFFVNCRDISRYVNTLSFSFPRVKEVVNPVDFFALTAIEVFSPQVYLGIRDNKDLFTDLIDNVYPNDDKLNEDRLRCDEVLHRSDRIPKEDLLTLLMHLFPRLRHIYQPSEPFYHSEALARKNRRICSPDVFDVYFRMSLPVGFIPESELNALLELADDLESLNQALLRLNQDGRATVFLDLIDSVAISKIPLDHVPNVIKSLLETSDLFPEGESGQLHFNTPMRVHRIIHRLLRCYQSMNQRFAILKDAINNTSKSIFSVVNELTEQTREHMETEDTYLPLEHRDLNVEQLETLHALAANKIVAWAKNGRLIEHPKLLPILYAWKAWGNEVEMNKYFHEMVESDRGIIAFLCAALKDPIDNAMNKLEKNQDLNPYLKNIETFIPAKELEAHAKELFEDAYFEKLREREQLALMMFLDLIKTETVKIIPKTTV